MEVGSQYDLDLDGEGIRLLPKIFVKMLFISMLVTSLALFIRGIQVRCDMSEHSLGESISALWLN